MASSREGTYDQDYDAQGNDRDSWEGRLHLELSGAHLTTYDLPAMIGDLLSTTVGYLYSYQGYPRDY